MKATVSILALLLLVAGCVSRRTTLSQEAVWAGTVVVRGVEEVRPGKTLIIRPGTRVLFSFLDTDGDGWGEAGLVVRGGKIIAHGTGSEPISFEPEERDDRPGRWGEIRIEEGGTSRFVNCVFRGGRWALHTHFTPLRVESSLFVENSWGIKFRGGPVQLYGNVFTGNGTAIRYWESDPEIISNDIRRNGTGIFCREGSRRTLVRGNNFVDNVDYHIKLGELQEHDVDARFNFWGSSIHAEIEDRLFDKNNSAYLGRVRFKPPEPAPFPLEWDLETADPQAR